MRILDKAEWIAVDELSCLLNGCTKKIISDDM